MAASDAAKVAFDAGVKKVDVYVKGPGQDVKVLSVHYPIQVLKWYMIKDMTPLPHNGCRPPKKRRV